MIAFEQGCPYRKRLEDWYAARGAMPERAIELNSYHSMLGCVVAGMGIALLPKCVLATFSANAEISVHNLTSKENRLATVLIWRKGARSPKTEAFRRFYAKGVERVLQRKNIKSEVMRGLSLDVRRWPFSDIAAC